MSLVFTVIDLYYAANNPWKNWCGSMPTPTVRTGEYSDHDNGTSFKSALRVSNPNNIARKKSKGKIARW